MIKLRPFIDDKDLAKAVAEYLFEHGREAARNVVRYDPQAEDQYKQLTAHLGRHYDQISKLMDLTMNDQASTMGHEILAKLMLCAWNLGNAAAVAPEVQQKLKEWQTAKMRDILDEARNATPEEAALLEAVRAECKAGSEISAGKEAVAILGAVNRRLTRAGFVKVNKEKVRRRIEKLRS